MAFGSFSLGCERDNSCYAPFELEIFQGQTVSWLNLDVQGHTVASGTSRGGADGVFLSPVIGEGQRYDYTFDELGTFEYFCTLHPWMVGIVAVSEMSSNDGANSQNNDGVLVIPDWIKSNAQWWSQGLIGDAAFVESLEYLIKNGVIILPDASDTDVNEFADNDMAGSGDGDGDGDGDGAVIPDWIKSNAQWWSQGLIDDATFVGAIKWMIINQIIVL